MNILRRISISEILATRIRNSFLKNENSSFIILTHLVSIKKEWVNMDARFVARIPMFTRSSILEKALMTIAHAHTVRSGSITSYCVISLSFLLSNDHDFML